MWLLGGHYLNLRWCELAMLHLGSAFKIFVATNLFSLSGEWDKVRGILLPPWKKNGIMLRCQWLFMENRNEDDNDNDNAQ